MIIDDITHLKDYIRLLPMLKTVVGFLDSHDLQALPEGRPPKAPTQAVLESHRKMIDIQIPLTGDETMGYSPLKELKPTPYDETKDISFYKECSGSFVTVKKGMFAIFFPQDAHAPGVTPTALKKAVFKIPVSDDWNQQ